jgi:hypothetical protein
MAGRNAGRSADEGLEEDRVVQEAVDGRKPRRGAAELVWEHRLEQRRLRVYLGTQHGGSNRFRKGW